MLTNTTDNSRPTNYRTTTSCRTGQQLKFISHTRILLEPRFISVDKSARQLRLFNSGQIYIVMCIVKLPEKMFCTHSAVLTASRIFSAETF